MTKRAGRKKDAAAGAPVNSGGKPQVKKAVFESTKKKEVGVSDLTLLSKISNEAINDNLKKRFENGEIYVCPITALGCVQSLDINTGSRRTLGMCWFQSTRSATVGRTFDSLPT